MNTAESRSIIQQRAHKTYERNQVIRLAYSVGIKQVELAKRYKRSQSTISRIINAPRKKPERKQYKPNWFKRLVNRLFGG